MPLKQNESSLSSKSSSQYTDVKTSKPRSSIFKKNSSQLQSDNVPKSSFRNSIAVSSIGTGLPKVSGAMSVKFSNEDKLSKIVSSEAPTALICPSDYEHLFEFNSNCAAEPPQAPKAKKATQPGDFSGKVAAIRSRKSQSVKGKKSNPQIKLAVSSVKPKAKVISKPSPSVKPPKEVMPLVKKIDKKDDSLTVREESSSCVCCLIM